MSAKLLPFSVRRSFLSQPDDVLDTALDRFDRHVLLTIWLSIGLWLCGFVLIAALPLSLVDELQAYPPSSRVLLALVLVAPQVVYLLLSGRMLDWMLERAGRLRWGLALRAYARQLQALK